MFEQYLRIKEGYPDALLFYRMGDFYELFFEDAEVASRELQIALTSRNPNAEAPIPMCGVPWHAAEGYVSQLLNKGYKIAFCDQVEDPRAAKGLVERAVTRVYTPGTAVEDVSLEPKGHTYLGALFWSADTDRGGFAWVDVSTGYWAGLHVKKSQELWQWAQKIAPRELLLPEDADVPASLHLTDIQAVRVPLRSHFDYKRSAERVLAAINAENAKMAKKYGTPHNMEQVPGESSAVKLARKDALLGYELHEGDAPALYSNQFLPLWTEGVDVLDRIRVQGRLDSLCTGGGQHLTHLV